jgi:hypothetical protein
MLADNNNDRIATFSFQGLSPLPLTLAIGSRELLFP